MIKFIIKKSYKNVSYRKLLLNKDFDNFWEYLCVKRRHTDFLFAFFKFSSRTELSLQKKKNDKTIKTR